MGKRKVEQVSQKDEPELLINPEKPWYLVKIKENWEVSGPRPGAAAELADITSRASKIYTRQVEIYDKCREMSKSDRDWLKTVINSGTANDKCSTFQIQLAEAPLYGAEYLTKLLEMAKSTSRHESSLAIATLTKVFESILPPVGIRKLLYIKQRKWENAGKLGAKTLMVIFFEDTLKRTFFELLKILEIQLQDQIAHSRGLAMRSICQLGKRTDEQLSNISGLLANKLGDPDRKLASRAMFYLQETINAQKESTETVIGAVEQVIVRPGVNEKAQYYGLTFLSQILLSHSQPEVTERLVKLYMAILKNSIIPSILKEAEKAKAAKKQKRQPKKKNVNDIETELAPATNRLAKVVTTGLNRALPFYKGPKTVLEELSGPIQKLVNSSSFATSLQALGLYFQLATLNTLDGSTDGFVKTVEAVLLKSEVLTETSSHPQLLALLYKIVTSQNINAVSTETIVKAMFNLTIKIHTTAFSLSCLLLLAELIQVKPAVLAMINIPEDCTTDSCLWTLHILQQHYDHRVSQLTTSILNGEPNYDILGGKNPFEVCTPSLFLASLVQ